MSARIFIVAPSAYPFGGIAVWLEYLYSGLQLRDWDIRIGLVEGPKFHRPEKYAKEYPDIQFLSIPCMTGTPEGRCRAIEDALDKVVPDIIVSVNIPDAVIGASRWMWNNKKTIKIVMAVHGIQPDIYCDMALYKENLHGVICTNRLACALAIELGGIMPERVYYAQCGTDVPPLGTEIKRNSCIRIAYVGRLEQDQKRVHDLSQLINVLHEKNIPFEFIIAGVGPEESSLRNELDAFIKNGSVRIVGHIETKQIYKSIYQQVDVLVVTSRWETGPIVIWEAMANGVAIVTSQYVGLGVEGALKHKKNAMLFPIGDVRQAAESVLQLWSNPDLLSKIRYSAWETVNNFYTTELSVSAWESALLNIYQSNNRRQSAFPQVKPATGRLDKLVGTYLAESIRRLVGKEFYASEPGGEWPHTHSASNNTASEYWEIAQERDISCNAK